MIAECVLLVALLATTAEPSALEQAEQAASDCDELVGDIKAADAAMRKLLRKHLTTTTAVGGKTAAVAKSANDLAGPERAGMTLLGVLGVVAGVVGGGAAVAKGGSMIVSAVKRAKATAAQLAAVTGAAADDDEPPPPPPLPSKQTSAAAARPIVKREPSQRLAAISAASAGGNGHGEN